MHAQCKIKNDSPIKSDFNEKLATMSSERIERIFNLRWIIQAKEQQQPHSILHKTAFMFTARAIAFHSQIIQIHWKLIRKTNIKLQHYQQLQSDKSYEYTQSLPSLHAENDKQNKLSLFSDKYYNLKKRKLEFDQTNTKIGNQKSHQKRNSVEHEQNSKWFTDKSDYNKHRQYFIKVSSVVPLYHAQIFNTFLTFSTISFINYEIKPMVSDDNGETLL